MHYQVYKMIFISAIQRKVSSSLIFNSNFYIMRKKHVDEIDLMIINQLQTNAWTTNRALARTVGLSPGPTLVRVQNLWKRRLIAFCRITINYNAFRFNQKAILIASVPDEKSNRFIGNLKSSREVVSCFELTRKSPLIKSRRFLALVYAKTQEELQELVEHLCKGSNVQDLSVVRVEKTYKDSPLILTEADL